jgi:hypothetical protein
MVRDCPRSSDLHICAINQSGERWRLNTPVKIIFRRRHYILVMSSLSMDSKAIGTILAVVGFVFIIVAGQIPYIGGSVALIGTACLAAGIVGLVFYSKW